MYSWPWAFITMSVWCEEGFGPASPSISERRRWLSKVRICWRTSMRLGSGAAAWLAIGIWIYKPDLQENLYVKQCPALFDENAEVVTLNVVLPLATWNKASQARASVRRRPPTKSPTAQYAETCLSHGRSAKKMWHTKLRLFLTNG